MVCAVFLSIIIVRLMLLSYTMQCSIGAFTRSILSFPHSLFVLLLFGIPSVRGRF